MIINKYTMSKLECKQILDKIVSDAKSAPKQKSAEWYKLKKTTIGGSEIAKVLGCGSYGDLKSILSTRVGISSFQGNEKTRWGNLFEEVSRMISEELLITEIVELGSLPGKIKGQNYSPDGLSIIEMLDSDDKPTYYVVLFEFKSPYSRIPDGKIPKEYMPQVQTGLLTLDTVDFALFVNNCFRRCPLADLNFKLTYDTKYHTGDVTKKLTKAQKISQVYAAGLICFYQTVEEYESAVKVFGYGSESSDDELNINDILEIAKEQREMQATAQPVQASTSDLEFNDCELCDPKNLTINIHILQSSKEQLIDFGKCTTAVLHQTLYLFDKKRIKVMYMPPIINDEVTNEIEMCKIHGKIRDTGIKSEYVYQIAESQIDQFYTDCDANKYVFIGYLPWKLVKSDIIQIDRDEDWLDTIKEPIESAIAKLNEIMSSEDPRQTYLDMFEPATVQEYLDDDDVQKITEDELKEEAVNPERNTFDLL